jgi:hypothetical protein
MAKNAKSGINAKVNLLGSIIGFQVNASNVTNMLFMQKGDLFMQYVGANKLMDDASYPSLRLCLERDLTILATEYDKTGTTFPWGKMSIKMKSHSMAVSIYKTWQRRILDWKGNPDAIAFDASMFSKFDKTSNTEENKDRTITKKSVFKAYDKKAALDFLNNFLSK